MIYEMLVVAKSSCNEKPLQDITKSIHEVIGDYKGKILVEDEWGLINFAQSTTKGERQGHFFYFLFEGNGGLNGELTRRFNINENVFRNMIVKVGDERTKEKLVKNYKTPFSKEFCGSVTDEEEASDTRKQGARRKFVKRKNCWFTAKAIKADWKDPLTYNWLVNEFGKISPARVTGVSRKHQRFAISAIKRARQMGIMAYLSNGIAGR